MAVTVGDILRVVAVMSYLDGDILQNVFNVAIASGSGPFDDADILDDMVDWLDNMYANLTSHSTDEVDGSECRVYFYDSVDDDWDEVGIEAFTWDPSAALEQLPRGVALLLNAKSSNPDVNGKKYIGALTEGAVDDGLFNAATITGAAAYAVDWFTDFVGSATGATFNPGIWSPTRTAFFEMGEVVIIPSIPAYQRRRKNGVGI